MADQADKSRIIFSPTTFERHSTALDLVSGQIQTRDPRKGTSRFPGIMSGRWGLLASEAIITAGSGTTLGTGTVKLCDRNGTLLDPDNSVDVLNPGSAITATGDTIVALEWTAGDWSVCGCVAEEVDFCIVLPRFTGNLKATITERLSGDEQEVMLAYDPDIFGTGIEAWYGNEEIHGLNDTILLSCAENDPLALNFDYDGGLATILKSSGYPGFNNLSYPPFRAELSTTTVETINALSRYSRIVIELA